MFCYRARLQLWQEKDLLEIQGKKKKKEYKETQDTVIGYLTAENVFQRIEKHWKELKRNLENVNIYTEKRMV